MKTADVVIVGCGVIGASVAYHLAVRGFKDIVVLDRARQPGEGSTSKATGGFRAQFGTKVNVQLSLLSREKLLQFHDELGIDPGYRQYGYLFLADSMKSLTALRSAQRLQKDSGLQEVQEVTAADIKHLNPAISLNGLLGGMFCPTDGFVKPMEILRGYVEGAKRLGVGFEFGVDCLGFKLENIEPDTRRITAIHTPKDTVTAGCVVNAAGAWASVVAQRAGVDIPIEPVKRQVAVLQGTDILPENMPMTIFVQDGFHFRVRDGRVLLLLPTDVGSKHPFDVDFDDAWLEKVTARAHACVPCLTDRKVDRTACLAGLYEMSPDKHALLGLAPGTKNFYLVNGSSGHGVMHAPALGQLLAEIIVEGSSRTLNTRPLRPARFEEGEPNESIEFL